MESRALTFGSIFLQKKKNSQLLVPIEFEREKKFLLRRLTKLEDVGSLVELFFVQKLTTKGCTKEEEEDAVRYVQE